MDIKPDSAGHFHDAINVLRSFLQVNFVDYDGESVKAVVLHPALLQKAMDLIEKNCTNPVYSVSLLAADLGVHRGSLSRLFKQHLEIGPAEYLSGKRMEHGLNLLRTTNLSVKEIASRAGYHDPNYFSASVRKLTGKNTGEIRRESWKFVNG